MQCYSLLQRLVEQKPKSKVGWRSNAGGRVEGVNQPLCGFQHVATNKTCDLHSKLIAEPADSAVSKSTHGSNEIVCIVEHLTLYIYIYMYIWANYSDLTVTSLKSKS